MRAAVLEGVEKMVVRKVVDPAPLPNEVLLRVKAVGVCGTDLHLFRGHGNYHLDSRGRPIPLEEQPQCVDHLIHHPPSIGLGRRITGNLELLAVRTDAETEHEPPLRHPIQRRREFIAGDDGEESHVARWFAGSVVAGGGSPRASARGYQ